MEVRSEGGCPRGDGCTDGSKSNPGRLFRLMSRNRRVAILGAAGLLAITAVAPVLASSHREAPLISGDPAADNTDLYAFVSPDKPDTVTIIANYEGLQEPSGGPNYYPF